MGARAYVAIVVVIAVRVHGRLDAASTPPMGWRSWNCFLDAIDHDVIASQVTAMSSGALLGLGYGRIGIDGGWVCQNAPTPGAGCTCGGVGGSYHDASGNPVVGLGRFPNLTNLTAYAHSVGVKLDFYGNSCNCAAEEQKVWKSKGGNPDHDVAALLSYGMDGIKVDGCSPAHNITRWVELLSKPGGSPLLLENCGDNGDSWSVPPVEAVSGTGSCGFQMYRISSDIAPQFYSAMSNLQSLIKYSNVSRPGCWAYPDMLQVGSERLSDDESRTHFAAWCVSSAPLILGYNLADPASVRRASPFVTNKQAIAINQAWHGHAGRPVSTATETFVAIAEQGAGGGGGRNVTFPVWQVWAKPLRDGGGRVAVLLINLSPETRDVSVTTESLQPWLSGAARASVSDVWTGKALGVMSPTYTATAVPPHGSQFVIVEV